MAAAPWDAPLNPRSWETGETFCWNGGAEPIEWDIGDLSNPPEVLSLPGIPLVVTVGELAAIAGELGAPRVSTGLGTPRVLVVG